MTLTLGDLVTDMSRPHTLVEFRLAEHQLVKTMMALDKRKNQPDFKLDVEFYRQLQDLIAEFNYTFEQVIGLLVARDKFGPHDVNPLLDLIPAGKSCVQKYDELGLDEPVEIVARSHQRQVTTA